MTSTNDFHRFSRIDFTRFKAFKTFRVNLNNFNILVGPNNAGKSTMLAAFRILAAAMRTAGARKSIPVRGPHGMVHGHKVDISSISVGEENIFYNYDSSEDAEVVFRLSNKNSLKLYFSEAGGCVLISDAQGKTATSPSTFKRRFNCPIGFVPILGPVEHNEQLYTKEAARQALFNYRAARNFRNIWHHYPDKFEEFCSALRETWPGMDITPPEIDTTHVKPLLFMFCPEDRILRELFWSGFGFQVWCQMLTHLIQSKEACIFLIDEPDIYLHSDLQRQLLTLLRNMGPDILIATHSTEIISEAETNEIVIINKHRQSSRRLQNPSQLAGVFEVLGSNTNPTLTQIAETRRALFVEGKDFSILGRFARKLGQSRIGNRQDFAVVPVEGFNPERIRNLKSGMEEALGVKIVAAAILDRDFRSNEECVAITKNCRRFCTYVKILKRKEIENFLLVPKTIDRAVERRIANQQTNIQNSQIDYQPESGEILNKFAASEKSHVTSQIIAGCQKFSRSVSPKRDESTVAEEMLNNIDELWNDEGARLRLVSGKDALARVNSCFQKKFGVNVTSAAIIEVMKADEISPEMKELIDMLVEFTMANPDN